jgi:tetratricopeptide (TPR) repeat protein
LAYVKGTDFAGGISTDIELKLLDLESGKTRSVFVIPRDLSGNISSILWTPDGAEIIMAITQPLSDGRRQSQLEILNIDSGSRRKLGDIFKPRVACLTYDPEGNLVVSCWYITYYDPDKKNHIWKVDLATGHRSSMEGRYPNPTFIDWFTFPGSVDSTEITREETTPLETGQIGDAIAGKDSQPIRRESTRQEEAKSLSQDGAELANKKQWAQAEAKFRRALELDPENPDYQRYVGVSLARQGKWAEAETALMGAIQMDPPNADFRADLAAVLWKLNRADEAISALKEAIRFDPSSAAFHDALGVVLKDQQRFTEAEDCFREAVRLNPQSALYHGNLAEALYRQGREEEAIREAQEAKRLGLSDHSVFKSLGM